MIATHKGSDELLAQPIGRRPTVLKFHQSLIEINLSSAEPAILSPMTTPMTEVRASSNRPDETDAQMVMFRGDEREQDRETDQQGQSPSHSQ